MNNHKLTNKIFIESSRSNFFVYYIIFPILTISILNGYFFKNLFLSIACSIIFFLIFHLLVGYRFFKRISFFEDNLRIDHNLLYKYGREIDIPYDKIHKVKLKGGVGFNQTFIKICTSNSKYFIFFTNDWDEKDMISNLEKKANNMTIENRL